jgi:hypothetical protein
MGGSRVGFGANPFSASYINDDCLTVCSIPDVKYSGVLLFVEGFIQVNVL